MFEALSIFIARLTHRMGNERGAALVEYALLIALIAVVCIVAVQALGNNASTTLGSAGSSI